MVITTGFLALESVGCLLRCSLAHAERSWEVFRTVLGAGTCEGECGGRRRMLVVRAWRHGCRLCEGGVFSLWGGQGVGAWLVVCVVGVQGQTWIGNWLCLEFHPTASTAGVLPIIGTKQHHPSAHFSGHSHCTAPGFWAPGQHWGVMVSKAQLLSRGALGPMGKADENKQTK